MEEKSSFEFRFKKVAETINYLIEEINVNDLLN